MNDNLPEINFKEKKEKKRGALGWLRNRLGLGSRGAMGEAGINPSVMNVGRALGTAKIGTSAGGFAAFLAGNAGMLATVAMVAVAAGVYLAHNAPDTVPATGAFSSGKTADSNYVPAILRSQSANQGSSLDMFKETNKGAGLAMEGDAAKAAADKAAADAKAAPADEAKNGEQPAPEQNNMAQDMMGKLQGGNMASLTSQLGGGSSKFSGMGGFNNKFGQGATGAKAGFSSGLGAGFSGMPKFDQRKNKMMAMKGSARPVFGGSKAGKRGTFGSGAFSQAKGLKATQKSYTGTSIDSARSTQDKAWEGSTPDGSTDGGAGLSDGGAGVVTSPSLDNSGNTGGGGGLNDPNEPTVTDASGPEDVSPWKGLPQKAMMLILMSAVLGVIGALLIQLSYETDVVVGLGALLYAAGMALCIIAMGMALMALMIGIQLMTSFGQTLLGTCYTIGGAVAMVGAGVAMTGDPGEEMSMNILVLAAVAGVLALIGSMLGGK